MRESWDEAFKEMDAYVRENLLDFYLDSCDGIPNAMWSCVSQLIGSSLAICVKILPYALFARLVYDEFRNRRNGVIDLRIHVNTIFTTILIFVFLENYRWVLQEFDALIKAFYFYIPAAETTNEADVWTKLILKLKATLEIFDLNNTIYLALFKLHIFFIIAMKYARSVLLMMASIFGPIATLTYFLNRNGFSNWSRSYLNISCWGITLNAFEGIAHAHKKAAIASMGDLHFLLGSISIAFLIFMTPTITSWFIGNAVLPNLAPVANFVSKGISLGLSFASQALTRFIPSLGAISKVAGLLKKFK